MFPAAITVRQPFATLLMHRIKLYETRTWRPAHNLPMVLFIHAARTKGGSFLPTYPHKHRIRSFPLGHLLGLAVFDGVYPADQIKEPDQAQLGIFQPANYAWHVYRTFPFPRPIPCPGAQGIWRLPQHIRPTALEQIDDAASWLLDTIPGRQALRARGYTAEADRWQNIYPDPALLIHDKLPAVMMDAPPASTTTQEWFKWLPPHEPTVQQRAS
jgi:hypothetical protein